VASVTSETTFQSRYRQTLFLELAAHPEGVTADEVHEEARNQGDTATIEAYHNLGRRLTHKGLLVAEKRDRRTAYKLGAGEDQQWLDETLLARIAPAEYPLIGLTVLKAVTNEMRAVSEEVWGNIRDLLSRTTARSAFFDAICSYCDDLHASFCEYVRENREGTSPQDRAVSQGALDRDLNRLVGFVKHGLGLSKEAVNLPSSFRHGISSVSASPNEPFYNADILRDELSRRIADEPLLVLEDGDDSGGNLLIAGVDGSMRGGLLTLDGETGDLAIGGLPLVTINTAVAQIDRYVQIGGKTRPAFLRLPEKPEDMQQEQNRYTMMVKLFHPELSDSEYAHALWAAMNLLESRATLRALSRWSTPEGDVEIRPADIVLCDGTVVPNDRDFNHYKLQSSYGRIVRELIEKSWDILRKSRDDRQVVAGVVKNAQLHVYSPVINWVVAQAGAKNSSHTYAGWPLDGMNYLNDQTLLTRILTAGRKKNDPWLRSCIIARPFLATTNYARHYSRTLNERPMDMIMRRKKDALSGGEATEDDLEFWREFRDDADPFVQMLNNAWFPGFFLGCMPRLDGQNTLPRLEFMVLRTATEEGEFPHTEISYGRKRLLSALKQNAFAVAQDHDMFSNEPKLDVLPRICIEVHNTVKIWAADILNRAKEYAAEHLSRFHRLHRLRGVGVSKWRKKQLEAWVSSLIDDRNKVAGNTRTNQVNEGKLSALGDDDNADNTQ
jgi:hypothetical protein